MQPWLCCEHFTFTSMCVCVCVGVDLCSNREGITNYEEKNNNTNGGISRRSTTMTTTMITWHVCMEKITKKYSIILFKKTRRILLKNVIKVCVSVVAFAVFVPRLLVVKFLLFFLFSDFLSIKRQTQSQHVYRNFSEIHTLIHTHMKYKKNEENCVVEKVNKLTQRSS